MNREREFTFKKRNIYLLLGLLFFKLVLDYTYIHFVYKMYSYSNFIFDFNALKYLLSLVWFLIIFLVLPKNSVKTSSIVLILHFMIMILPMFTLYAMSNYSNNYFNMVCFSFSFECILLNTLPTIKIIKLKKAKIIFYVLVSAITIFVYTSMLRSNGIPNLGALNLLNVYEIRGDVNYPLLMGYLVNWQAKAINPLMIAISYKKNSKMMMFFIVLQILLYLITAHKSFLFIPIAIILVMYMFKHKNIINIICYAGSIGCILAYVLYKVGISLSLASFFIRRFMFVPAQLKFFYYDFISKNEFIYFSRGIIGKLFNTVYPYDVSFLNLIGEVYYNNPATTANTGYLGSGYANMGFVGILIYTILFSFILIIIDSIGKSLDKSMVTGVFLFSMLSLNDIDLLTTLLTGGLLFLLILLYLYATFDDSKIRT